MEIYAWIEKKIVTNTTLQYEYEKAWTEEVQNSAKFSQPEGHENPTQQYFSESLLNSDLKIGNFEIDTHGLGVSTKYKIPLNSDTLERQDIVFYREGKLCEPILKIQIKLILLHEAGANKRKFLNFCRRNAALLLP